MRAARLTWRFVCALYVYLIINIICIHRKYNWMQYGNVGIAELQMYRKNISESSGSEYRKYVSKSLHNYLPTKHLRTLILPQSIKYQGPVLHCHSCAAQFRMCMCLLYTADFAAAFWAPGFGRTRVRPVTKASEIANSNCMRTFQHVSHCLILLGLFWSIHKIPST